MIEPQQLSVYQRIQDYDLDNELTGYGFSERLAKENQWTQEYSEKAIAEYKKMAFLAVVCDHPITPSKPLDQVWHLHLIYSYCYWEQFCPHILNYRWHHHPGSSDPNEEQIYQKQYQQTLDSYRSFFNEEPPREIWGISEDKKLLNEQKNNKSLIKPILVGLSSIIILSLSGCTSNPLNYAGPEFLSFYLTWGLLDLICAIFLRMLLPQLTICRETGLSRWIPASLMFSLSGLGVVKIFIGLSRGKPVDTLTILAAIAGFIGWLLLHPRNQNKPRSKSHSSSNSSSGSSCGSSCSSSICGGCSSCSSGCGGCSSS